MKIAFKSLVGATAVASMLAAAGTASASDATKCHSTIIKNITKYQAALAKNLVGCHKSRTGNKLDNPGTTLCNTAAGADLKGKNSGTRDKIRTKIVDTCTGIEPADQALVLARYQGCPSPLDAIDDGMPTNGIDNFTELSNCLFAVSEHYIDQIGERGMGNPSAVAITGETLSEASVDCQGAVGKALSKYVKTVGGTRSKCFATDEKNADNVVPYSLTCATTDASGKIQPALDALSAAYNLCTDDDQYDEMGFTCVTENLQELEGHWTLSNLRECAYEQVAAPIPNGLAGAAIELAGVHTARADITISAANGTKKLNSETRLDSGWKGTAHQVDVIDQSLGAVTISGCDIEGKNCEVTHNSAKNNCRCSHDATQVCSQMNVQDTCGGGNTCFCMFGPPLSISASSTPVCVVNRFSAEFTGGTADLGEYDVLTQTRALVHLGIGAAKPCPVCTGADTANDGVKGGVCSGGLRNGSTCDVNAVHPDFGASSFDCPPSPGANISGSGLLLALNFESGNSQLTAGISNGGHCDTVNGNCHCSVCSGDSKIGCFDNTPCTAAGAGTCGAAVPTLPQQNNCTASCTPELDGSGVCDNPVLSFCDGYTNQFGNGFVSCVDDTDCDTTDCDGNGVAVAGECGDCTLAALAKCFPPTVTATGDPGIYESIGVSSFCSGITGNAGVDNAGGLPGPGRVKLSFDFDLKCPNGTRYQLPMGPSCP